MFRTPLIVASLIACAGLLPAAGAQNVVELNVGERDVYLHVYRDAWEGGPAPRAEAEAGPAGADASVYCITSTTPSEEVTCDTPSNATLDGGQTPASTGVQCARGAPPVPPTAFCGASVAVDGNHAGLAGGTGPIPGLFLYGCTFRDPSVPRADCRGLRAEENAAGSTCFYYWQRTSQGEDQLFLECIPLP